jgi:hypothetical protein
MLCTTTKKSTESKTERKTKDNISGSVDNVKSEGYTCMYVQACRQTQSMQDLKSNS